MLLVVGMVVATALASVDGASIRATVEADGGSLVTVEREGTTVRNRGEIRDSDLSTSNTHVAQQTVYVFGGRDGVPQDVVGPFILGTPVPASVEWPADSASHQLTMRAWVGSSESTVTVKTCGPAGHAGVIRSVSAVDRFDWTDGVDVATSRAEARRDEHHEALVYRGFQMTHAADDQRQFSRGRHGRTVTIQQDPAARQTVVTLEVTIPCLIGY